MPGVNLSGSPLIKRPADLGEQPVPVYNKKEQQKQDIQKALSGVLRDGVISNDEIVRLAKLDFTVEDVQNTFNRSLWCVLLSDDERQKLTDDLMTRIETYRQLNQERKGQEPKFGL
jgi:hypothetical protein